MNYTKKINSAVWVLLLLPSVACIEQNHRASEIISIPLDSITSSQSDYVLLSEPEDLLFIKSLVNNSFEVYNWKSKNKIASIYTTKHLLGYGKIQSIAFVNYDTLLLLQRNNAHIFYCNIYGHIYDEWNIGLKALPHFSITTNPTILYGGKMYVSVLPQLDDSQFDFNNNLYAVELAIDFRNQTYDTITITVPKKKSKHLLGLRHNIPTRVLANGKLTYIWGGGSKIVQYDIEHQQQQEFQLSELDLNLGVFMENYVDHKQQQDYYFRYPIYDHISYNDYDKVYYLYLLHSDSSAFHKYKRSFTIFKLNDKFELVSKKSFEGDQYAFDNELITKDGLYISRNNPFSPSYNEGFLNYELIIIN